MIAVIVATAVPDHVRGYLGRFFSEIVPGVFVGRTSKPVADRLWHRTTEDLATGFMAIVTTDATTEQGYVFRTAGTDPPTILDLDGLHLVALIATAEAAESTHEDPWKQERDSVSSQVR